MNMLGIYNALELGSIYGIAAIGVYLTFRIIDFPDLTVNSSFTSGAAVMSVLLLNSYNFYLSLCIAAAVGAISGILTALLNIRFNIQSLLAGIISMIGLYSINMRIMGRPNLVIASSCVQNIICDFVPYMVALLVCFLLYRFFISEIGLGIRAAGKNKVMAETYGVSYSMTVIVILALSNALVAISGALFCQLQGFADIGMGNGLIIIGLASVIIGERIYSGRNMLFSFMSCIVGAFIYELIISSALSISGSIVRSSDIYLITSIIVIMIMATNKKGGY